MTEDAVGHSRPSPEPPGAAVPPPVARDSAVFGLLVGSGWSGWCLVWLVRLWLLVWYSSSPCLQEQER